MTTIRRVHPSRTRLEGWASHTCCEFIVHSIDDAGERVTDGRPLLRKPATAHRLPETTGKRRRRKKTPKRTCLGGRTYCNPEATSSVVADSAGRARENPTRQEAEATRQTQGSIADRSRVRPQGDTPPPRQST